MALSLNITLDSTPEAFQSTPISLRWEHDDPLDFVLGAFSNFPGIDSVMVVMANQVVENFTEDRIVDMSFNYTSASGDDCFLIAWIPHAEYVYDMLRQLCPFSCTISDLVITLLQASRSQ